MGYPCDKIEIKFLVGQCVKQNNSITSFKDSIPDDDCRYYSYFEINTMYVILIIYLLSIQLFFYSSELNLRYLFPFNPKFLFFKNCYGANVN